MITTDGGPARQGQVFELDPATDEFRVLFASPGNWLFVNVQTPGITFAITGPWAHGALGADGTMKP